MKESDKKELELNHKIFLEIYPRKWFKHSPFYAGPILIRKVNIRKCYMEFDRQEAAWNSSDREPINTIVIEMEDGEEYYEHYINLTQYGIMSYEEVREIAESRFDSIVKQLTVSE